MEEPQRIDESQAKADKPGHSLFIETEASLTALGQRRVNIIWEYTQSFLAVLVVMACVGVCILIAFRGVGDVPQVLTLATGVVIGFYFGRTNHERVGGVGLKPTIRYEGR